MDTTNNTLQKLAVGAKQGLIGSFGGRLLSVVGNIVAARILGPTIFGLYAVGWTLLRFVSLIVPLGMDRVFLRFAPKYWKVNDSALTGLLIQTISIGLGSGLFFGTTLYCIAPWLSTIIYKKSELEIIFRYYAAVLPFITLLIVFSAITRMTQKIKYSVLIQDLGQPFLGLCLMVVLYVLRMNLKGVIYSDIISITFSSLVGFYVIFKLFPEILKSKPIFQVHLKELFSYSLPAAFGGAFSVYIFWIDRILIGIFRSSFENGVYLAVSQISTLFLVINAGINGIVVPLFSDLFLKRDHEKLNEVYKISTKWSFYFSAPFLIVMVLSSGDILSVIYGEPFRDGANILLILLIGQVINLITGSVNPLLGMTGNQKFLFKLSGIIFLIDIVLNIVLIPILGLTGGAISTSFCLSILYIIEVFWVKKNLNLWPYDKRFIKGILAFALAFICAYCFKLFVHLHPFPFLIIQLLISILAFSLILILQKLDEEDRMFLSNLIH